MVCLRTGHWVEGELSIGVERPLMHFEDEKKTFVQPKIYLSTLSFSGIQFILRRLDSKTI